MHGECSVPLLQDAVQRDSAWLSVLLVPRSWLWHCRIYSSSQNRLECSASRENEIQQTISSRVRLMKSPVCTSIYRIHRSRCLGSNRRSAATTALRGAHIGNTGTCLCKWMPKALQVGLSALERGQYGWPEFVRLRAGSVWMVIMLGILSPLVRSSHAQPRAAPSNDEEAYHGRNSPMAGMAPEWKFSLHKVVCL